MCIQGSGTGVQETPEICASPCNQGIKGNVVS